MGEPQEALGGKNFEWKRAELAMSLSLEVAAVCQRPITTINHGQRRAFMDSYG